MVATGSGAGLGTSTRLKDSTVQKLALWWKKVLGTLETELCKAARVVGATIDPDVFK